MWPQSFPKFRAARRPQAASFAASNIHEFDTPFQANFVLEPFEPALMKLLSQYDIPSEFHRQIRERVGDILQIYRLVETTPIDSHHAATLSTVAASLRGVPSPSKSKQTSIGKEFDFLGRSAGIQSLIGAVNLAALSCIERQSGFAVVASARNEGPFLIEWIAHQYAIGFDKVFIYTNDNNDGSDELLSQLANHGYIYLINNETSKHVNPQVKAYEHLVGLDALFRSYEWAMFLDCDEFPIVDAKYDHSIPGLIRHLSDTRKFDETDCVCMSWLWFGSSGHVHAGPEPLKDRFRFAAAASDQVKSIFRTSKVMSMQDIHKPRLFNGTRAVNTSGEVVSLQGLNLPYHYENAWINHYWNKSFEEFLVKRARGKERAAFDRNISLFFDWDIACDPHNHRTIDPITSARSSAKHAEIMSHRAIREAHELVMQSYRALARYVQRDVDIDLIYASEKAHLEITRYLDAQHVQMQ